MNVLFISVDSLRRDCFDVYDESIGIDISTPNLDRFAEKSAVFDNHYAGSLPCMPARREWLTGTQGFLWRGWGPAEPFDDTLAQVARRNEVLTKLVSDHYHYIEHGGENYYQDFNGFEFVRGQQYDAWNTSPQNPKEVDEDLYDQLVPGEGLNFLDKANSEEFSPDSPTGVNFMNRSQVVRNALSLSEEEDFFAPQVFKRASNWLRNNQEWDKWLMYIDNYEIHEPFQVPEPYATMYTDEDPTDPDLTLYPYYGRIDEGQSKLSDRQVDFVRSQYAGKLSMFDKWFGTLLDTLDEESLWDETMIVVTSDHGYLLGEHGWIGKMDPPVYDILANTPLFIWHPNSPAMEGKISALTSAVDIYATILDALGIETDHGVHSKSLLPLLMEQTDQIRNWALYGVWGSSVNITDGQYTYMRATDPDTPVNCYSTQMMNTWSYVLPATPKEDAESGDFLPYADCPVWRFTDNPFVNHEEHLLFDVEADPDQARDLIQESPDRATEMESLLSTALGEMEAPDNTFDRLNLERP